MLAPGKAALIVSHRRGRSADRARAEQHVLERNAGDWDEAEQEALAAMELEAAPAG
jgi:hypothetical protein